MQLVYLKALLIDLAKKSMLNSSLKCFLRAVLSAKIVVRSFAHHIARCHAL